MSAHDLMEAVYARWSDQSLDSSIAGGLWLSLAPEGTVFPYCVYDLISNVPNARGVSTSSSGTEVYLSRVQFSLYDDKMSDLGAKAKALRAAYDNCSMTLGVGEGEVLEVRLQNEIPQMLEDDIWQWTLTYMIRRSLPINPQGA